MYFMHSLSNLLYYLTSIKGLIHPRKRILMLLLMMMMTKHLAKTSVGITEIGFLQIYM
jgi:hypothetical protein